MRLILTGSRDWSCPWVVKDWMLQLRETVGPPFDRVVIVHGAARGLDRMAHALTPTMGFSREPHPADWERFGRAAGPIRNAQMLALGADAVVGFKDGFLVDLRSGGTENMIDLAMRAGVPVEVFDSNGVAYVIPEPQRRR